MEHPRFRDIENNPRLEKATGLFAEGMLFLVADNFDEELAFIDEIDHSVDGEIESSLDDTERQRAIDVLTAYGFEAPSDVNLRWEVIAEETNDRDGFIETEPFQEIFSINLNYLNADVTFFITIAQGAEEVLIEKEMLLTETNLSLELANEKYFRVFSSDDAINQSLIETLLQNNIVKDEAKEIGDVTNTELDGLFAMIQMLKNSE